MRRSRCDLVTLTFDLETGAQCSMCCGVPFCKFWWYYDYSFMGYWACTFRLLVAIDWWPTAENRCCLQGWHRQITVFHHQKQYLIKTRSVTARFGRHGMPLPASKDTGTAFCFPNKEDTEMRHTDDVSLWLWPLILKLVHNVARVVACHSANFGDTTTTIRFRFTGYWALHVSTVAPCRPTYRC